MTKPFLGSCDRRISLQGSVSSNFPLEVTPLRRLGWGCWHAGGCGSQGGIAFLALHCIYDEFEGRDCLGCP